MKPDCPRTSTSTLLEQHSCALNKWDFKQDKVISARTIWNEESLRRAAGCRHLLGVTKGVTGRYIQGEENLSELAAKHRGQT